MRLNVKAAVKVATVLVPILGTGIWSVFGWGAGMDQRVESNAAEIRTIKAVDEERSRRIDQALADIRDGVREINNRLNHDRRSP